MNRAAEIIAKADLYTVGALSAKIKDKKTMDNITTAWNRELDKLTDHQYEALIKDLPRKAKSSMSLGDVLAMVQDDVS